MKKLVFDLLYAQPLGGVKFHGGGEYIKSVFWALSQTKEVDDTLEVCLNENEFLDDWILNIIRDKQIKTHQVNNAVEVVRVLNEMDDKSNVRFFTGMIYSYNMVEFPKGIQTIGVCHGLRGLEKPYDWEALRYVKSKADLKECIRNTILWNRSRKNLVNYYTEILEKFDVVITDSEHSEYSIRINFPELTEKKEIKVFYAPAKYTELSPTVECNDPFIMMVSADRWLKNSYRGVTAIDRLYQAGHLKGIKTRVYGNLPTLIRDKLKYKENFEFYGYVSSKELEQAYQSCSVFFYPTLNEGFGLPPLEAMKYGRTCVISAICSLPEIYGDSVYYCNPYDIMEMENRLLHAVEKKISEEKLFITVDRIRNRQNRDLSALCNLLIQS